QCAGSSTIAEGAMLAPIDGGAVIRRVASFGRAAGRGVVRGGAEVGQRRPAHGPCGAHRRATSKTVQSRTRQRARWPWALAGWFLVAGCERWPAPAVTANEVERSAVVEPAPPRAVAPTWSPRTRYAAELRDRAPEDADRWMAAADRALASPVDLTLPVRERVAWVAREVEAVAYAFELPEGRAFELRLDEAFE